MCNLVWKRYTVCKCTEPEPTDLCPGVKYWEFKKCPKWTEELRWEPRRETCETHLANPSFLRMRDLAEDAEKEYGGDV